MTGLLASVHASVQAGAQVPVPPQPTELGSGETILFMVLAPVIVIAALGLLVVKKAVHAAVLVALVMICLAVMYAAQDAQFLFAAQIVVYTGAVMMLFLFVLMLVGVDSADSMVETIKGQRWVGVLAGLGIFLLVAGSVVGYALPVVDADIRLPFVKAEPFPLPLQPGGLDAANADGNPVGVARLVFGRYVFAFEVVGTLLIIAAVGAILMTHRERLVPKQTQAALARARTRSGLVTPLPAPGVFARSNAVDTPALLPDGSPSELSVSRVLRVRGQNRSASRLAGQVEEVEREITGRPGGAATGRDAGNASPETGEDAVGSPPGDPGDPARPQPPAGTDAPEGSR